MASTYRFRAQERNRVGLPKLIKKEEFKLSRRKERKG
jgi:hypothetical protein